MSTDVMERLEKNEIRTESVDFSFGELLNLHREKEIIIRPEYQRLFRWSTEQRSRLIESILLKLPIPPIFLIEDDDGVLELIDGLQRTSSVLQFLEHEAINEPELVLQGCDILKELNGMRFSDFSTSVRLGLKRTPIRAIIIKKAGNDFVKYEMFKRLNTGGSLLAPQEIRNCSCRMITGGAEFYAEIQGFSSYPSFVTATGRISDEGKEQRADEELVLRFFAVQLFRDKFAGNVREWLDSFMEAILFKEQQFGTLAADFYVFFDFLADKFGDAAFVRWKDGMPQGKLAPAYFEAVCGGLLGMHRTLWSKDESILKACLTSAFEDSRFKAASGPGANSKPKMEERISVVREYFEGI